MFIRMRDVLKKAQKGGYAVGAFNTNNLEVTQAITSAAKSMRSPVIIQTTPKAITYAGLEDMFLIVKCELENIKQPGVLHLDHAKQFEMVKEAIDAGYLSVMIDASHLDFEENVHLTSRVVSYAHSRGVDVEAEIGRISKGEEGENQIEGKTDPEEAERFIKLTKVDSLAVSVGNVHGAPKGEKLDLKLLKKIKDKVSIPLVLHGSSGLSSEDIKFAVKLGVCKVNIDTKIKQTVFETIQSEIKDGEQDYRQILTEVKKDVSDEVKKYIEILGSKSKG